MHTTSPSIASSSSSLSLMASNCVGTESLDHCQQTLGCSYQAIFFQAILQRSLILQSSLVEQSCDTNGIFATNATNATFATNKCDKCDECDICDKCDISISHLSQMSHLSHSKYRSGHTPSVLAHENPGSTTGTTDQKHGLLAVLHVVTVGAVQTMKR